MNGRWYEIRDLSNERHVWCKERGDFILIGVYMGLCAVDNGILVGVMVHGGLKMLLHEFVRTSGMHVIPRCSGLYVEKEIVL